MNIAAIKAGIFVLLALTVAAFCRPRFDNDRVSNRIIGYWMGGAAIAFLIQIDAVKIPLLGILMLTLTPKKIEDRAAFFLCSFLALPLHVNWIVPFPGINYLVRIDHAMLASVAVAFPLLIAMWSRRKPNPLPGTPLMDTMFVSTYLLIGILNMRGTTFTDAARGLLVDTIIYLVPYLAISRGLASRDAFQSLARGATTIGVLMIFIAMLTLVHNWNHYTLAGNETGFVSTTYRSGSVRVNLTMMHTLAGVVLGAAFICLWFAARHANKLRVASFPLLFLSGLAILGTQSRGALLSFMLMIGAIVVARLKSNASRFGLTALGLIGLASIFIIMNGTSLGELDEFGTFTYREQLLKAGLAYIPVHPLFGSADYANAPAFAHLVQGQGIIDFVNGYLQYTLRWGLVGLGLILSMAVYTLLMTVRAVDRLRRNDKKEASLIAFGIGYIGVFFGFLISLTTTSDISYYPLMLVSFLAIGQAYRRVSHSTPAIEQTTDEITTPVSPPVTPFDLSPGPKGAWS